MQENKSISDQGPLIFIRAGQSVRILQHTFTLNLGRIRLIAKQNNNAVK
jgi:hypothetical protein